ncbi:hypothetical protein [Hwangdonia seohaensis]|uniref:Uncharacterized protein n=1 Tax=Hwangdonia seohaensis TaxID=1240727 RepID=A0ABW3RC16_9FLAO|nr:hypothetical protein [Hwangdonia seohaensis]
MSKDEKIKPNLLHRIKFWFKLNFGKKDKPYSVKSIDPLNKARAMDKILELCIKYKVRQEKTIDFYKVEGILCDELDLHSWESELLLDIMADQEYIKEDYKENRDIEKIYITPKGIEKYINGGFALETKRKIRERKLIRAGQYLSIVIGIYYTATLIKEFLGVTPESLYYLICKTCNFLK